MNCYHLLYRASAALPPAWRWDRRRHGRSGEKPCAPPICFCKQGFGMVAIDLPAHPRRWLPHPAHQLVPLRRVVEIPPRLAGDLRTVLRSIVCLVVIAIAEISFRFPVPSSQRTPSSNGNPSYATAAIDTELLSGMGFEPKFWHARTERKPGKPPLLLSTQKPPDRISRGAGKLRAFALKNAGSLTTNDWFPMPFACIFVPDFPVESVCCAPNLRLRPRPSLCSKVSHRCRNILRQRKSTPHGIDPGMTKIQVSLAPNLYCVLDPGSREAAAHAALLDCAQSFSPRIEDTASDTVVLDLPDWNPSRLAP